MQAPLLSEVNMKKRSLLLRIYVARHCETCAEARRIAEKTRQTYENVQVEIMELDGENAANPDDVFSVPTWVLDGKVISLGNPSYDELSAKLSQALL